jgi:hypothetical protein
MKNINKILFSFLFVFAFMAVDSSVFAQTNADLSPTRKRAIDSLALEKVKDLSRYISLIGSKETQYSEAMRVIDRAMELFSDGAQMGVSSVSSKAIRYYGVRKYFDRLMALNYDQVTIDWFNIQYISDLELQPDGRYVGVITIFQRFQGKSADGLVQYSDVTKKDITVYVERKKTIIAGREIGFWDVMLGDVRVSETKRN